MITRSGLRSDDPAMLRRLRKRRAAESRFRLYGRISILLSMAALGWLLLSILMTGLSAFTQHWVTLDLTVEQAATDGGGFADPNYRRLVADALARRLEADTTETARAELLQLVSASAATRKVRQNLTDGQVNTTAQFVPMTL
ncbi:MAG: DUF3333 domain-containing protein, partial [Pseudomonadota bacterium]